MSALTEGVKAIYARKRKRLLQYDGGMSSEAIGVVTPPVRYETLETNALATLRNLNLTQQQLLDKTGMLPNPGDGSRFVTAHYRAQPNDRRASAAGVANDRREARRASAAGRNFSNVPLSLQEEVRNDFAELMRDQLSAPVPDGNDLE